MIRPNMHYKELKDSYLFYNIAQKTKTYIEEHPGITVTELAEEWVRTKGSISQVIKNLDENGYIIKKKEGNNNKNVHLYPTSKGVELSLAHKMLLKG